MPKQTAPLQWSARLVSVIQAAVVIAIISIAFETTVRVEDWVRYRTPIGSAYRSQSDLVVRDADGIHGRPGARYKKWILNNIGTRGPDVGIPKPANTTRVALVGASETFGLYESPGREYPRQLEDSLRRQVACASTGPVEVLNTALPGMSLPTVAQNVDRRLRRFEVDFIVFYPTPPQYLDEALPRAARPDSSNHSPRIPLRPRGVTRLRTQAKALVPSRLKTAMWRRSTARSLADKPDGWRFEVIPDERLEAYEAGLRSFVGSVRAIGATPVLATHANMFVGATTRDEALLASWVRFYPRATGQVIVAFDSAASAVTVQVAQDSAIPLVDVRHAVRDQAFFSDFSHFTDLGAARVASAMSAVLAPLIQERCPASGPNPSL